MMKIAVQYVSDEKGKPNAVQLPVGDWKKLLLKLRKYEQALKLKSDLEKAFEEVKIIQKSKKPKQTLNEFLNEL